METFPLMQDNSVTGHSPHPRVTSTKKSFEFKTGPGHSPYPRVTSNKKRF